MKIWTGHILILPVMCLRWHISRKRNGCKFFFVLFLYKVKAYFPFDRISQISSLEHISKEKRKAFSKILFYQNSNSFRTRLRKMWNEEKKRKPEEKTVTLTKPATSSVTFQLKDANKELKVTSDTNRSNDAKFHRSFSTVLVPKRGSRYPKSFLKT